MFKEGSKIVYNRIRDTVAPFLATATIGYVASGRPTVKLPRTRADLGNSLDR
jgi:hypothetical protein